MANTFTLYTSDTSTVAFGKTTIISCHKDVSQVVLNLTLNPNEIYAPDTGKLYDVNHNEVTNTFTFEDNTLTTGYLTITMFYDGNMIPDDLLRISFGIYS